MKNKKRVLLVFVSLIFLIYGLYAQDSTQVVASKEIKKTPTKDKIYYGGNIGLAFGSYTMIAVRPLVAYKISSKLSGGVKLSYEYISDKRYSSTYKSSNYGGSLFARYRIVQPIYLHAEYAAMNYELYNAFGDSNREWVPFLLVGAGYSQRVGNNSWLNVQILFDVLQNNSSPYRSGEPFYSVGVGVGF